MTAGEQTFTLRKISGLAVLTIRDSPVHIVGLRSFLVLLLYT